MPPRKKQQTLAHVAYPIVDPKDYMSKTVWVPGAIFGEDFANTVAIKKQLYPMLVVGWDQNKRIPDHRSGDLTGVVTVQDLTGYKADSEDRELTFDHFELKLNYFSKIVHDEKERKKAAEEAEEVAAAIAKATTRVEDKEQQTKVDKRTSRIHQFFRPFDIEGVRYMKCILCPPGDNPSDKGVLAVQPSTNKNLFRHIEGTMDQLHQAQKEYLEAGKINGKTKQVDGQLVEKKTFVGRLKAVFCEARENAVDNLPASALKNKWRQKLMQQLDQSYVSAHKETLLNCQLVDADMTFQTVYTDLQACKNECGKGSIGGQADMWTRRSKEDYGAMTLTYLKATEDSNGKRVYKMMRVLAELSVFPYESHSAANIAQWMTTALLKYGLSFEDISVFTPDAANNMTAACREARLVCRPCFGHGMQRAMGAVLGYLQEYQCEELNNVQAVISKMKRMVQKVHQSNHAKSHLQRAQLDRGIKEQKVLSVKQDCPTRWNSTVHMLERNAMLHHDLTSIFRFEGPMEQDHTTWYGTGGARQSNRHGIVVENAAEGVCLYICVNVFSVHNTR